MLRKNSSGMKEDSEVFLTDTHAHLASKRFSGQVDEVLSRSRAAGIGRIISISCDVEDAETNLALATTRDGVFATAGIHPCYIHEPGPSGWLEKLSDLSRHPRIVAIGETGLDHYHPPEDGSSVEVWHRRQVEVFEEMLRLAEERDLPVVVHSRESTGAVLDVLERFPGVRAVLHCFVGTWNEAERALAGGHFLSFTGVITYPKSGEIREVASRIPLDRIMVETDAPYLAPVPFRGKPCEPAMVVHTSNCLAELHGLSPEEMARQTSRNAATFFRLDGPLLAAAAQETGCATEKA